MSDFNPDTYLETPDAGFDPDKHLEVANPSAAPSRADVLGSVNKYYEKSIKGTAEGVKDFAGGVVGLGRAVGSAAMGEPDELVAMTKGAASNIGSGVTTLAKAYAGDPASAHKIGRGVWDVVSDPEKFNRVGANVVMGAALNPEMLAGRIGKVAEVAAPLSVSDQILATSRKAGYVVPPATANPSMVNRTLEGFAGKANVAQAASIKNQAVTNGLVRKALNLPEDAPLTADTLAESRGPAGQVYEQVKNAGTVTASPQYAKDLDALTRSADSIQKDFPKYSSGAQAQIKELADSLKSETFDSGTAVELSKDLRYNAASNYSAATRTGDPTMRALAQAQQKAAEALENELGRHLESTGKPDLAGEWDAARTHIAKTYSVQNALDGAGNVDATKLGKQLLKGKPLSDELETAANFANAFPKAARVLPGKESMPGMSPLDVYGSVAASLAAGNPAPMLLGPGRMAARGLALSRAFQSKGVREALNLTEAPK